MEILLVMRKSNQTKNSERMSHILLSKSNVVPLLSDNSDTLHSALSYLTSCHRH